MSNTDVNTFLLGSRKLENSLLQEARATSDPATILDVQFSVMESGKKEGARITKAQDFNVYVAERRELYFESLKTVSNQKRVERRDLFNNFVGDYYRRRYDARRYSGQIRIDGNYYDPMTFNWFEYFTETNQFWRIKKERSSAQTLYYNLDLNEVGKPGHFTELRRAGIAESGEDKFGWYSVLDKLQFDGSFDFFANMAILLKNAFPFVSEYEAAKNDYYYFVGFAEEFPLPTPEMMDMAAKKACYFNTQKYSADSIKFINYMATNNADGQSVYDYYLEPPPVRKHIFIDDIGKPGNETTYGMPDLNPQYNDYDWYNNVVYWKSRGVPQDKAYTSVYANISGFVAWGHSTHPEWWWPRPRDGYSFVSKVGFIFPPTFTFRGVGRIVTPYQFQENIIIRQKAAAAAARRRKKRGGFGSFLTTIIASNSDFGKGDVWRAAGRIGGGMLSLMNPLRITQEVWSNNDILKDVWRETENFTGNLLSQAVTVSEITPRWIMGEPISEEELMMALDLGIKAIVIVASGGTAAAVIGVAAGQLQRGSWGEDEIGSILLSIGEVAAIAYTADLGVQDAASMFVKNQVTNMARREVYARTDLDETAFGVFAVELGVGTGRGVYDGAEWGSAMDAASNQATLKAMAKESPELALVAVIALEVGRNGIDFFLPSDNAMTKSEDYFNNFSWDKLGTDIRAFVKTIDKDDLKRIVGLTIMVAAGKMSGKDAMRFIGKTVAERQITRFYNNEPASTTDSPRAAKMARLQAEVNKAKREEMLFQKVRAGHIPSPHELKTIIDSGSAKWIYESISEVIPSDAQNEAWNLSFDLGFPSWDAPNLDVPDWAKVGKTDVPEWAQLQAVDVPEELQVKIKEKQKEKIGKSWEKFKNKMMTKYAWENILSAYLQSLWPRGVPLRQPGNRAGEYKYIGPNGQVYLRKPLDFSYEHPMILTGKIKQRFSDDEQNYMAARKKELEVARITYKKLTGEELPTGGMA